MSTSKLKQKFADPYSGVYFIGTTPPKSSVAMDEVQEIGHKLLQRLDQIDYDGVIVYDIQDESSRTEKPRPFPFKSTHDPRQYSSILRQQSGRPVITYKSVSQRNREDFDSWLDHAWDPHGVRDLVLVGSPSSDGDIRLSLPAAYEALREHQLDFNLGGVTIAERHTKKGNEHIRLIEKAASGCQFFISQAVYDAQATIDLLSSYARECRERNIEPKRIILTFSPCGCEKTLEFIDWLGISVPLATRHRILDANDPLAESIRICRKNLDQILAACGGLGIPLGLNIESLTNRKAEIDASIRLYKILKATLDLKLAEQEALCA